MQEPIKRKPIVAGNWKMHGSQDQAKALLEAIQKGVLAAWADRVDIVVFPSFVHLPLAKQQLKNTAIAWGGQNLYVGQSGAFTGEISGTMLADYGCRYVLVGHSERRSIFHEDLLLVAAKFKAALAAKLQPILCLGETLMERNQGKTEAVIAEQLESVVMTVGIAAFEQAVIAYEPVWAIGSGLTATPEQAQNVHAFIRHLLARHDASIAKSSRILYGGSVKADNAHALFEKPDIDGGLIGGASLEAASFLSICSVFR